MRIAGYTALSALMLAHAASAAPLEAYGPLPSLDDVALSPDGSKVTYVIADAARDRRLIVVQPTGGGDPIEAVNAANQKVRTIKWVDETHLIVVVSQTGYARDILGPRQEYYEALIFDLAAHKQFNLMEFVIRGMNVVTDIPQVRMVAGHPVVFAQGVYFPEHTGRLALYAIDPQTRLTRLIDAHSANTRDWFVDAEGHAMAEEDFGDVAGRWTLRLHQDDNWNEIYGEDVAADAPEVEGFSTDGKAIVVRSFVGGDTTVKAFSLADGKPVASAALDNGSGTPITDRLSGRIIGFRHLRHDIEYEFVDPADQAGWKKVLALFPHEQVELVSASDDRSKVVVLVTGITHGYAYFVIDTRTGQFSHLGPAYNAIAANDVNRVVPLLYAAGDGRQIDAYLTLPRDREVKDLPLIVLPHGGPASRDEPGFDWWPQALSSLGYAVLQPQFRGSDGFGWDLLSAGFGEWGRKMQTDLSDGVRALVRTGVVDPKRVCIVGGSYGGYAALAGATLDPGVYRCAVSVAGISDLRSFISWRERRTSAERLQDRYWLRFTGASSQDDPVLDAISPLKHIDKVTIPILLIHGHDDTVVPIAQSEDMVDALKRAGKTVTFVPLGGEDHWLSRSATRLATLKAMAEFLRANNPP